MPYKSKEDRKAFNQRHQAYLKKRRLEGKETAAEVFKRRYCQLRKRAARRGLAFSLTFEQFKNVVSKACAYGALSTSDPGRTGVDRKDNDLGYLENNVVPCCRRHNTIKNEFFTYDEMFEIIKFSGARQCGSWKRGF